MPAESPRIAELRRRVQADPASIAFAQLAEEYRRAGQYHEAVRTCRAGLGRHPGYLSARVTLGRALSEIGGLDEAAREFALVLKSAPDNLAAMRGLAEIHQRRGDLPAALEYYKRALALARFDPDLEESVTRIGREIGNVSTPEANAGLSFEQATSELLSAAANISRTESMPGPAADSFVQRSAPSAPADAPIAPSAPDPAPSAPDPAPSAPDPAPSAPDPAPVSAPTALDLIDFDALLASLGVPDAAPPPLMEVLLSEPAVETPRPEPLVPELPATVEAGEPFADLERELRALDDSGPAPSEDAAVSAVLDELESWMRVLEKPHDSSARQ